MRIEIKSRFDARILFAHEAEGNTLKITVEAAVKARANLADANLADANLAGVNLAGANLAGANQMIDAGTPNGWRTVGWLRDGYLSIRVGCRDKRLAEGREYWDGKDDRREVLAALDYIEKIAVLRGWKVQS